MEIILIIFGLFLLISFTYNFINNKDLSILPEFLEDENEELRYKSDYLYRQSERVLTKTRLFYQKISWPFNYIRFKVIHLKSADSFFIFKTINFILLIASYYMIKFFPPIGFILSVFSISSVLYLVILKIRIKSTPNFTFILSSKKNDKSFLKELMIKFEKIRYNLFLKDSLKIELNNNKSASFIPAIDKIREFTFGNGFMFFLLTYGILAILQRIFLRHIMFDDTVFTPLYIAIPVIAGSIGKKTGFFSGLLGFWMVFSMIFPTKLNLLFVDYNFKFEGWNSPLLIFLSLSICLGLIGYISGLLINKNNYAPISILLWIIPTYIFASGNLTDIHFWGTILIAIGLSFLGLYYFEINPANNIIKRIGMINNKKKTTIIILAIIIISILFHFAMTNKLEHQRTFHQRSLDQSTEHIFFKPIINFENKIDISEISILFSSNLHNNDRIYLDGYKKQHRNNSKFTFKITPGIHNLGIRYEGYDPINYKFSILNGEIKQIKFTLPKRVGKLDLKSMPSDVSIYSNGKYIGKTPVIMDNLNPGRYEISYQLSNEHIPIKKYYDVEINKTIEDTVYIKAKPGTLSISTSSSAIISLDERRIINESTQPPGNYNLKIRMPNAVGLDAFEKEITIYSDRTTNITHIFPSFGSLSIKCRPAGKIFIDDKLYKNNSSSVYIGSIVEGIHSIKIKKFGYATYTGTITINKNSTTKVSYNYSFSKKTWVKR